AADVAETIMARARAAGGPPRQGGLTGGDAFTPGGGRPLLGAKLRGPLEGWLPAFKAGRPARRLGRGGRFLRRGGAPFPGNAMGETAMAMDASEIERLIKLRIPDAEVTIRDLAGDGDHYAATVLAESFRGKSRVQQHQIVYEALKAEMGGKLHALAL